MNNGLICENGHMFVPSDKKDYEQCTVCGTYHSINQTPPNILYEEEEYWNGTTRNTFVHQGYNMLETETCGISKVDKVFQYVKRGQSVLEIACAPGELLKKFTEGGYTQVYGIEPSERYLKDILGVAQKANILLGYFPDVTKNSPEGIFDVIVGMDVFEHVEAYKLFINEIHRILRVGGTAILMSPIIFEDGLYRDIDFVPIEHCYIHTKKYLDPYLKSMFHAVEWDRWIVGHELIIMTK